MRLGVRWVGGRKGVGNTLLRPRTFVEDFRRRRRRQGPDRIDPRRPVIETRDWRGPTGAGRGQASRKAGRRRRLHGGSLLSYDRARGTLQRLLAMHVSRAVDALGPQSERYLGSDYGCLGTPVSRARGSSGRRLEALVCNALWSNSGRPKASVGKARWSSSGRPEASVGKARWSSYGRPGASVGKARWSSYGCPGFSVGKARGLSNGRPGASVSKARWSRNGRPGVSS